MKIKAALRYLDTVIESSLKSDLDKDYKPKGRISLSDFKAKQITEITPEMKKSTITFFKHIDAKRDTVYVWMDNDEIVGVVSVRYGDKEDNHNWITAIQVNPKYIGY